MPRYDRTGPQGEGPMSGGGQGRCIQGNRRAFLGRYPNTGWEGRRMRGMAQGSQETSEVEGLKSQISSLNDMVKQLNRKISELEKNKP